MDIDAFIDKYDPILDRELRKIRPGSNEQHILKAYEDAMIAAGFDFADSEQFFEEYIIPVLEELKEECRENDRKALDIYREAGLDEIKVRWRKFDTAKLNLIQARRIKKLADDQRLLGDTQLHFIILQTVLLNHRPELTDRYKTSEIYLMPDRK